jgi:hypothetical protein
MIRKVCAGLLTLLAVLVLSVPLYAAETITHQGRLLDATDKPVADGSYGATFSLWDDPVAGVQVWSEFRDIQTKSGLFSVELGQVSSFFDIFAEFANRDLYLQTQVQIGGSTETLSPRLRIGSVPTAFSSKRLAARNNTLAGNSYSCSAGATDTGAAVVLNSDSNGDGIPDFSFSSSCDNTGAQQVLYKKGLNAVNVKRAITSSTDDLKAVLQLDADSDDDGVMDRSVSSSCDATGAKHAINTKGTGGTRVASVTSSTTELGASSVCSLDLDGDGVLDRRVNEDCDDVSASRRLSVSNLGSSGQDGVDVRLRCDVDSAVGSTELRKNGALVSADYDRKSSSSNSRISSFFDVFTEMSMQDVCDATGAVRKLSASNLGSSGQDGVEIAARPGVGSRVRWYTDSDGDGIAESSVASSSSSNGADLLLSSSVGGGMPNRISMNFTVAKQTQGATFGEKCFVDGDDIPESEISNSVTPTTSGVAIKTKGTGANDNRVISSTDDTSAVVLLATDDASITMTTRKGGVVKGVINVNNGSACKIGLGSDGNGFFATGVGVGVDPTHPVDVAGGAYCDGTNWVNASDVNSKENFQPVNGEELLDKISGLEITKWNYKGDTETEHIGPTAQDFKAAFGVGSDGKSISTIDPSGIALAGVKELRKENQELKSQVAELKKMVEELAKKK